MSSIVDRLRRSHSLQDTFTSFCQSVADGLPIDEAGLAQLTPDGQQFVVLAEWRRRNGNASTGRRFDRSGTVGDFVLRHGEAFVGPTIDAVNSFPATSESLRQSGFKSNYVAPLADGSGRVLYMLSAQLGGLAHEQAKELDQSLGYLVEILRFSSSIQAQSDFRSALDMALGEFLERFTKERGRYPRLKELEAAYLRHLSQTAHFRVEGIHGGAGLSGLKPSTLRYRLERLTKETEP